MAHNVLPLREVVARHVREAHFLSRSRSERFRLPQPQFVRSAARRGALHFFPPAPSPGERSESTRTEHRRRSRGAERVSGVLGEVGLAHFTETHSLVL